MKRVPSGLLALLLLAAASLTLLLPADRAAACTCASPSDPQAHVQASLEQNLAIFSGTVREVVTPSQGLIISAADDLTVHLDVEAVWNGEVREQAVVFTPMNSASCGYEHFQPGARYLISADTSEGRYTTLSCSMTLPLADAEQQGHLAALGDSDPPLAFTTTTGAPVAQGPVKVLLAVGGLLIAGTILLILIRYRRSQ